MVRATHSQEQVSGRMKRDGLGKISYGTIYLMIYANHEEMGIYQQYLRQMQKQRRRKAVTRSDVVYLI
jgi:IS30 family transposase